METKADTPQPSLLSATNPWQQPISKPIAQPTRQPVPPPVPASGSFLNDWLAKRQQLSPAVTPLPDNRPLQSSTAFQNDGGLSMQPPNAGPAKSGMGDENISSELLDQQESDRIAKALEQGMHQSASDKSVINGAPPAKPADQPTIKQRSSGGLNEEDTIYIDRDGNLRPVDQP